MHPPHPVSRSLKTEAGGAMVTRSSGGGKTDPFEWVLTPVGVRAAVSLGFRA